jgi:hypothetical protein
MTPVTHNLLKDVSGSIWHYSVQEKVTEKPRKVEAEWVRLHFGERVHIALQERQKVNVTLH